MTEPTTASAPETDAPAPETEPIQEKPEVDWKAKAREWEKRAKANADAATKLAGIEEAQKTAEQKAEEDRLAAEQRAIAAERELTRMRVLAEVGLEAELHEFVSGDTEDDIRAKAEKLKAKTASRPAGSTIDQGVRNAPLALNGDPLEDALKRKLGIA